MCGFEQQQACFECTKKCLKTHGRKPSSTFSPSHPSTPHSFFKIMLGEFSKAMFIPPTFARTLGGLVNQYAYLEDSNGHRWRVKISLLDGCWAFHQGWREFVRDHSIKIGEFVLFKYNHRSLFSAQIFGTTACERVNFGEKNTTDVCKRKRNKTELSPDNLHVPKNCKSSEASKEKCHIVEEDSVKQGRARKIARHDLSGFKLFASNCVAKNVGKDLNIPDISRHDYNSSGRPQTASKANYKAPCHRIDEDAKGEEEASRVNPAAKCSVLDTDRVMMTKESISVYNSSRRPQTTSPIGYAKEKGHLIPRNGLMCKYPLTKEQTSAMDRPEAPCNMVHKKTVCKQKTVIPHPTTPVKSEMVEAKCFADVTDRLVMTEEKSSHHYNCPIRSQTKLTGECTNSAKKNQITSSLSMAAYHLSQGPNSMADKDLMGNKGRHRIQTINPYPEMIDSKLVGEGKVVNRLSRPPSANPKCTEDEGGSLFAPMDIVRKFFLNEEGICYIVEEELLDGLEVSRITPLDMCVTEKDDNVCQAGKVAGTRENTCQYKKSSEVPHSAPRVDCPKGGKGNFMSSSEVINKDSHTEGKLTSLGNALASVSKIEDLLVASIGSVPQGVTDMPEYRKDSNVMQGKPHQSGRMPAPFAEADDELVTPCSKGKALKAVKIESMAPISIPLPNSISFRFSISVNAHSWLELPLNLPSCMGKRRHERKVVTLQDPSMRLWPVLYHESFKFVGFLCGWEAFTKANNLKQGDICDFEATTESEPKLQVRFPKRLQDSPPKR